MKNWVKSSIGTLLMFVSVACVQQGNVGVKTDDIEKRDTLKNDYAETFRIIYLKEGVQIDIIDLDTKENVKSYVIGKDSTQNHASFSSEINRVATTSTTHIGMLRELGLEDKIIAVSSIQYLCQPFKVGTVTELGEFGYTANAENFVKANPDIIFYSGFDMNDPILKKLEHTKLKTFLIYEWQEQHPLGRAEWIKVYGILFNKINEANEIYSKIKDNYLRLVQQLSGVENRSSVLVGTPIGDIFNAPAGDSYMAKLLADANVNYVYAHTEGTGSLSLTLEEIITQNLNVDFWINMNAQDKMEVLDLNAKFEMLNSYKTGRMFSYIQNVNCFWEKSLIEPDKVLEDFGKIFHEELFEDSKLSYYSKIE